MVRASEMSRDRLQRELPQRDPYSLISAEAQRTERCSGAMSLTKTEETDSILVASMGPQSTQLIRGSGQ